MARVYLAVTQKAHGFTKLLVLKVLRNELDLDGEFLEMFEREARVAARLNHPNVVQTYEIGEDQGRHFIAMEYLEGQPLSAIFARVGRDKLPLGLYVRILSEVLEGLHYSHELTDYDGSPLRIVHRDVSPQNVFVTYGGLSKILDFGIAKVADTTQTQHGVLKGKVGYMAPEQASGKAIDRRSDIFAIGVMLWEGLVGRRLVPKSDDEISALTRRISGLDMPVREAKPDADPELAAICERAMMHDPDRRYPDAAAMQRDLETWMRKQVETPDARKIATLLDAHFAEERTLVRKRIEDQLKRPTMSAMIDIRTESTMTPPLADGAVSGTIPIPIELPVHPSVAPTRSKKIGFVLAGIAALVGAVGVASLAASRTGAASAATKTAENSTSEVPITSAAPTPPPIETTPAPAPAAASSVTITLRAQPPGAAMTLDGKTIPNPHTLTQTKDTATHTLFVSARGHAPQSRSLVLDRDQQLDIALDRAVAFQPVAPRAATTPQPAATPTAASETDPSAIKKKKKRTIDDGDPYQ